MIVLTQERETKPLPAKLPFSYIHEYNEKVCGCHIKVGRGFI